MTTIDQQLINLIDQRIKASSSKDKAIGTCASRDSVGPGGTVLFDGSTVAMPVKVLGTVFVQPGDRCVLDRYGTEWIVTGSFSAFGLGEASVVGTGPSGGTGSLTSATFIDLIEIPAISFTKWYDNTYTQMSLSISMRSTSGATAYAARFGLRLTPLSGQNYSATDYTMNFLRFEDGTQRLSSTYLIRALDIPAGSYSVQVRWRRQTASGTGILDSGDVYSIMLNEGVRSGSPIL